MAENAVFAVWHKIPLKVRNLLEMVAVRLAIAVAAAYLLAEILVQLGYVEMLAQAGFVGLTTAPPLSLTLDTRDVFFWLGVTLAGGICFSPWRAPSILFGGIVTFLVAASYPFTRYSPDMLKRMIPMLESLPIPDFEPRDPPLDLVLVTAALLLCPVLFALAEASRELRKAHATKGTSPALLRKVAGLQLLASGVVAGGAVALTIILTLFLQLIRQPLRELPVPRVNPVVGFLIMGIGLAFAIIAVAWEPKPSSAPKGFVDSVRQSLEKPDLPGGAEPTKKKYFVDD